MNIKKTLLKCAVALCMCTLFTACGAEKLNPEDYCTVKVAGAEGYGRASLTQNYLSLEMAASACVDKKASDFERLQAAAFADTIKFEIVSEKTEGLKNGDVIEVEVIYDKDLAKDYGFVFAKNTFKHKVENLEEAQPIDPFDGLVIEYDGYSPKATFYVDTSDCDYEILNYVTFDYDNSEPVANGDTITIKAKVRHEEDLLEEGYVIAADTKNFVVEGLKEGRSIDPFEGLVINYTGIAPDARISFDTSGCDEFVRNNVTFNSSSSYYSNGDTAKVTINYSNSKVEENGVVFTQEEKDFVVSGAAQYPDSDEGIDFTEIDDQFLATLETKMSRENFYKDAVVKGEHVLTDIESDDTYTVKSIEYIPVKKMYFKAKNPGNSSIKNNHLVVWEIKLTAEKTARTDSGWDTHDDLNVGTTVTISYLAETYIQNFAVAGDGALNTENARSIGSEIYYKSASGKRWNNNVLNVTPDSICEKWRTNNAADFNVTITDVPKK